MPIADSGLLDVGSAPFMPYVSKLQARQSTVSLLRRLPDGTHVAVWSHACPTKEAKEICGWMWGVPDQWCLWGRMAVRLGDEIVGGIILEAAGRAAEERAQEERLKAKQKAERRRLAREITLYLYDPQKRSPSLGLQRGCDDKAFWRMTFTEKWERDRVVDWLRWQKGSFLDLEAYFHEHGGLALERQVLAGMREAERHAKMRGHSSSGRRPLRFWRGEE